MRAPNPDPTDEKPAPAVEHHPACKDRCVPACRASPGHPFETLASHGPDAPRRKKALVRRRIRPISGGCKHSPSPLWEHVESDGCFALLRDAGLPVPLPETYTAYDRADERYNLDRWTRAGGVEDKRLDAVHASLDDDRKNRAQKAPDVSAIAEQIRAWFPDVDRIREDGHHLVGGGGVFVGLVWGLALWHFGRDKDPLPEHAIGRMLPGAPLREVRPPFHSPTSVLFAAETMPSLGGGSMSLEIAQPTARTWSRWDEIKVHGSKGGTDAVRGEQAVHRTLTARLVARRASLSAHEAEMVAVLSERGLTHEERVTQLREVEARRCGIDPDTLVTEETRRLRETRAMTASVDAGEREAIAEMEYKLARRKAAFGGDVPEEDAAAVQELADALKARKDKAEAHQRRQRELDTERAAADKEARPRLLRAATSDVSDGDLLRMAREAQRRLTAAVERATREDDPLITKRPPKKRRREEDDGDGVIRLDMSAAPAGLNLDAA